MFVGNKENAYISHQHIEHTFEVWVLSQ